jgi:peptidoglycan/LPS O-acetylase OafA/YrhL
MTSSSGQSNISPALNAENSRLDYLDATRAFALVLGVVFHASLSFMPIFIGWAVQDVSTSPLVAMFMTASHSFRMETFFLLAGFFSHLTFHRKGAGEFARSRVLRIVVPFVVGWFILHPLLVSGWIMGSASLHGSVDVRAGLRGGLQSLSTLPAGIFTGSHLWFLYYLGLITSMVLGARGLLKATGSWHIKLVQAADAVVAWLACSRVSVVLLAIPTAATLWFMRSWGMDTPDGSLLPHLPALAIYGGFFSLGWMLNRRREWISQFARLTPERWIQATLAIAAVLLLDPIQRDPGHPHYDVAHVVYALSYALAMWSLVFIFICIFATLCSRPNDFIRYVADSSYWMYLIHLPVVIWLQVAVAELPPHWSLKLAFISTVTIAISLLTYDVLVRSTFIGWLLNGRRRARVIAPFLLNSILNTRRPKPAGAWSKP